MPNLPWAAAGTSHQSDATNDVSPARHVKAQAARTSVARSHNSQSTSSAGPSSTNATTATFTPGPLDVSTSANTAAARHGPRVRIPRQAISTSHGNAAYASSVTVVRFVKTTT